MIKKLLSSLVLITLFFLSTPLLTSAATLTIIPPKFEFTAEPGETFSDIIKLTNSENDPVTLSATVQDFVASGETGQPSFIENAEDSVSLRSWITINDGNPITVQPEEKIEIPFTITVPASAEPGGHYGAIFLSPPATEGQIGVQQRIGTLILIRVNGEINESGELTDFDTYTDTSQDTTPTSVKELDTSSFFEYSPVSFLLRFENSGNVHIKPSGRIEIYNFGQLVEKSSVRTILNSNGVPVEQEIVDYIPVNDNRGNVLAHSSRRFDNTFQGTASWYYHQDGTKEIQYSQPLFGYYTAKLYLTYGSSNEEVVREITFIIFPWKQALLTLLITFILIYGFIRYRRWSHARLRAQLMSELSKPKNSKK